MSGSATKARSPVPRLLLQPAEVAASLGIGLTMFYEILPGLIDRGLEVVVVGQRKRYTLASLQRLVAKAARREEALV